MARLTSRHKKLSELSRKEERRLLASAKGGNAGDLQCLCIAMEAIVYHQSRYYSRFNREILEDLEQVARMAVVVAVQKFDLDRTSRFSSYVAICVVNHIRDYLDKDVDMLSGVEAKVKKGWARYSKMSTKDLASEFGISARLAADTKAKIETIVHHGSVSVSVGHEFFEAVEFSSAPGEEDLQTRTGLTDLEMEIIEAMLDKKSQRQVEYEFDMLFGLHKHLVSIRAKLRGDSE